MLHRVFVDSDVLAARTPFEWLALLRHQTGSFQLHSSAGVVADAARLWSRRHPARRTAAGRRLALVAASLDEVIGAIDADIDLDEAVEPRRLVAAEIASCAAHVVVSSRPRRISDDAALPFEVWTPDEFLCLVDDSARADVREVVSREHGGRRRTRADCRLEPLAEALADAGCPAFAERVSSHLQALR